MNRPSAKNAFSKMFITQFNEAIASVKHNKDVRAVILRSDVAGVFSAGADLKERPKMTEEEVAKYVSQARQGFVEFSELPMPVLAALDGIALGGGLELAMATDIRVACELKCSLIKSSHSALEQKTVSFLYSVWRSLGTETITVVCIEDC